MEELGERGEDAAAGGGERVAGGQRGPGDVEPVAVDAATTYVASYHTTVGHYAMGSPFSTVGVDNPPLHALGDGVDGANGVYRYGAGGVFPTSTFVLEMVDDAPG